MMQTLRNSYGRYMVQIPVDARVFLSFLLCLYDHEFLLHDSNKRNLTIFMIVSMTISNKIRVHMNTRALEVCFTSKIKYLYCR